MKEYRLEAPVPGFTVLQAVLERLRERRVTRALTLPETHLSVNPPDRRSAEGRLTYREALVIPSHDGTAWVFAVGLFTPIAPDRVDRKPVEPQGELAVFQLTTTECGCADQELASRVARRLGDPNAVSTALFKARANGELSLCHEHLLYRWQGLVVIVVSKMQDEIREGERTRFVYAHPAAAGTIADQFSSVLQLERLPPQAPSPT